MNRGVAAGAPTCALPDQRRVRRVADVDFARSGVHLRMAFETKIIVALHEHLVRDRPMRLMANGAAFAQRFVLVNHHL